MFLKCSVNIFTLGDHCQFPFPIKGSLEINLASQSVTRFSKRNYRMLFIEFYNDLSFLGLLILILHIPIYHTRSSIISLLNTLILESIITPSMGEGVEP